MAFRYSVYSTGSERDFSVLDLRPYQQTLISRTFTDGAIWNSGPYNYQDTLRVRFAGGELVLAGKDFAVDAQGHLVGGRLQGIVVDRIDAGGTRTRDWSIEQIDMGAKDIDAALRSATTADDQFFLEVMLDRGSDTFYLQAGNDVAEGREGNDYFSGGAGDDRLHGGSGDDALTGSYGNDTLVGGHGNDTFRDVSGDDLLVEVAGGGIDTIRSVVSMTLPAEFENLRLDLLSPNAQDATGNAVANLIAGTFSANQLSGLAGDDTLDGLGYLDTMTGGSGTDVFRFSIRPQFRDEPALLADFVQGVDRIAFEGSMSSIGPSGPLAGSAFRLGSAAVDADDRILYDTATGLLRVDPDGSGTVHAPLVFARVAVGTALSAADFFVSTPTPEPTFRASFYAAEGSHDFGTLDFRPIQQTAISRTLVDGADYIGGVGRYEDTLTVRFAGGELVFAGKGLTVDAAGHLNGGRLQAIVVNEIDAATGVRSLDWSVELVDMGAKDADAALRSETTADDQFFLDVMLDRGRDTMELSTGNDTARGRAGDDYLYGDAGNDRLEGGIGADMLQGGPGVDTLIGGAGDDRYVIDRLDDLSDVRTEVAGGGTDWVYSAHTWTLAAEFENLLLTSVDDASNATGNGAANALYGNRNANSLSGLAGNDTLVGERGNDTLTGGAGTDAFHFRSAPSDGLVDVDTLADFASGTDRITLDESVFQGLGATARLSAAAFRAGTAAQDADDRIVFDAATGSIWYDADGNGSASQAVLFAKIAPGSALVATDIVIV
jgi:serralysin